MRWLALSTVIATACAGRDDVDLSKRAAPIVAGTGDSADPAVIALTDTTGA